jgi:putative NIF3 family GTP cyclohydrolase 1 type 2
VLDAVHNGKTVILTWHSNSERGFLTKLAEKFTNDLFNDGSVGFTTSRVDKDPLFSL